MLKLEARQKELQAALADADEPPPVLHPEMAEHYCRQITELCGALREESEARRMEAADILRSLIREIVLTPEDGALQIDLRGDLAGILAVSAGTGNAEGECADRTAREVRNAKSRPRGAAVSIDLVQQVEMVAGAGFWRKRTWSEIEMSV